MRGIVWDRVKSYAVIDVRAPLHRFFLLIALAILSASSSAIATPISGCALLSGVQTCTLYPSDASGNYSEVSTPAVSVQGVFPSGILLLVGKPGEYFNPVTGGTRISTSSEIVNIVYFPEDGFLGTYCGKPACPYANEAILYTPDRFGAFNGLPFSVPLAPSFNSIDQSLRGIFARGENYISGGYTYGDNPIHTQIPLAINWITSAGNVSGASNVGINVTMPSIDLIKSSSVPEPSSLSVLAAGIAAAAFAFRRTKRT